MTATVYRLIGVGVVACLASLPVDAQTAPPADPPGGVNQSDWSNEKFERQELREEMTQIRKQHEELESARDALKAQCANAQGAQIASCEQQRQTLREQHQQLHERTVALHEKIAAARAAHPEEFHMQNNRPWPHGDAPTAPTPGGAAPPAQ